MILIDEIVFLVLSYGWLLLLLSNAYFYVEWQHSDCSVHVRENEDSQRHLCYHIDEVHMWMVPPFSPPTNRITQNSMLRNGGAMHFAM